MGTFIAENRGQKVRHLAKIYNFRLCFANIRTAFYHNKRVHHYCSSKYDYLGSKYIDIYSRQTLVTPYAENRGQ